MSVRLLLLTAALGSAGCLRGEDAQAPVRPVESQPTRHVQRAPAGASPTIPEGPACLAMLDGLGVRYRPLDGRRGVETPVEVQGPLANVRYHGWGKAPLVMSCRLAVALTWIGPILSSHGVTSARHSGAYVYRTSRKTGRLSLHAHGLAIDLHAFTFGDGSTLSVERGYSSGQADPCAKTVLNHLACSLATTELFRELLTPGSDADHHDHFHLAIAPDAQPAREAPPKIARRKLPPKIARRRARPAKHYPQGR